MFGRRRRAAPEPTTAERIDALERELGMGRWAPEADPLPPPRGGYGCRKPPNYTEDEAGVMTTADGKRWVLADDGTLTEV